MPLDALTNFPNGISTSVVVLTEDGSLILSGDDGATIDLGTLRPVPLSGGSVAGLTFDSAFNVTGTTNGTFTSLQLNTTAIGVDTSSGTNDIIAFNIMMNGTAVTGTPGPLGIGIGINSLSSSFGAFTGIAIGGSIVDSHSSGTFTNSGITIGEINSDAGGTSLVVNQGLRIAMPIGGALTGNATINNYGIYISGAVVPLSATLNFAIYSQSPAPCFFGGALIAIADIGGGVLAETRPLGFGVTNNYGLTGEVDFWNLADQSVSTRGFYFYQKTSPTTASIVGAITGAGRLLLPISMTPATATAAGVQGTISWDAGFIYVCTATNTWKRVAIAAW